MRTKTHDDDRNSNAAFELAAGCAAVIAVAFAAAATLDPSERAARAVLMALGAGILAAVLHDWRATTGVAVFASLIYVGFLAHQVGELTGDATPWRYTSIIVAAIVPALACRWIRRSTPSGDDTRGPLLPRRESVAQHPAVTRRPAARASSGAGTTTTGHPTLVAQPRTTPLPSQRRPDPITSRSADEATCPDHHSPAQGAPGLTRAARVVHGKTALGEEF